MATKSELRLLFLLPSPPRLDGTHGGARTAAQFLLALANRHQIAVVYLRAPGEPPADPLLRQAGMHFEEIARPGPGRSSPARWRHRARLALGQLRGRPIWATEWAVGAYADRARALARSWRPDIVQIEHHIMAQYLPALAGRRAPRVLTMHEPGVLAARDRYRMQRGPGRLVRRLDLDAWRRFEGAILRDIQALVVFTERDELALAPVVGKTPIVRIPFGAPVADRPLDPLGQPPPRVTFVGNFAHPPNVDAALRLGRDIMPPVQARRPDARLVLVGDQPTDEVRRLASEGIVVTGRVADVNPFLDRAALVVTPLRIGGGMRVKVLEALSAGKALVASARAVAGLQLQDGEEFVRAESDPEFADAIERLLADDAQRAALAGRAWAWARGNLRWDATVAAYEALYQRLLLARHV